MVNWWCCRLMGEYWKRLIAMKNSIHWIRRKASSSGEKAKVRMANGSSREGWIYVYNRHPGKHASVAATTCVSNSRKTPIQTPGWKRMGKDGFFDQVNGGADNKYSHLPSGETY